MPHSNMPAELQDNLTSHDQRHAEDLRSMFAIASVGIATLEMLESLLPVAATEVERESQALSDHFTTLIHHIQRQGDALPPAVQEAIQGVVVGMQFQDRNTQVMANTVAILERYRTMLVEVRDNVGTARQDTHLPNQGISRAVQSILSSIRLSDIRTRYLEALRKAHVSHSDGEEPADSAGKLSGDIELF